LTEQKLYEDIRGNNDGCHGKDARKISACHNVCPFFTRLRLLPLLSESRCRLGLVTGYGKLFLQLKLNDDRGLEATKIVIRDRHETSFSLLITPSRNSLKIIELPEFSGE
jgi:hypothetical protein